MRKENVNKIVNTLVECNIYKYEDAEVYAKECLVKPLDKYFKSCRFKKDIIRNQNKLMDDIEIQGEEILKSIIQAYKVDTERVITKL